MTRLPFLLAVVAVPLAIGGCAATTFTARTDTPPTAAAAPAARPSRSFWEAVDGLDLESAKQTAIGAEQEALTSALESALAGNTDDAIATARRVWTAASAAATRQRSRELLESLLLSRSRWDEMKPFNIPLQRTTSRSRSTPPACRSST